MNQPVRSALLTLLAALASESVPMPPPVQAAFDTLKKVLELHPLPPQGALYIEHVVLPEHILDEITEHTIAIGDPHRWVMRHRDRAIREKYADPDGADKEAYWRDLQLEAAHHMLILMKPDISRVTDDALREQLVTSLKELSRRYE